MPGGMSCSWERHLAENLTNVDHMRVLRQRIDTEHEERLRRRRREREDAEVRRAARKVKTPTASDKFKTRSYDRPWAVGKPETRKRASSPSDSSNTSRRYSGSRLPDITNRAQGQSSDTRTPQTTKQQRHNKHPASKEDSLSPNKNKCVRTKTRQSLASGSLTCHQEGRYQYTSSQTETSPFSFVGQSKPPLSHSRESALMPQDQPLPRPWPRLPSLRSTFSWTPSDLDTDRQSLPDVWDISDMDHNSSNSDSSIPEEEEEVDDSEGGSLCHGISSSCASSIFSARTVSTDSCLSSVQPADTPLSTSFTFSSGSGSSSSGRPISTAHRSPLNLTPRTRASALDALVRDLPCLEPITSGSDEEEELEEELTTWQAGHLGRGTGVVRWRGPLSRPYLVPLPTVSPAAAVASRGAAAELLSRDLRPRTAPATGALDDDMYATMPSLEPIPGLSPAGAGNTSTALDPDVMAGPSGVGPVPRNVPPWLARLSTPVASPLLQAAGAQEEDRDSSSISSLSSTESSTPSPSPTAPVPGREASRVDTLGIMDLLGTALMAMRVMRQEIQRRNGHGNNGNDGTETGNDSGNGNDSDRENSTSVDGNTASAPEAKPQANPETLRRIRQSLLEESDEDEEEEQCRICQCGPGPPTNPLLSPCRCSGSLQYIHHDCLKKWIETKIESGADRPAVTTCELCKATLKLDLNDFDLDESLRQNAQAQGEHGGLDWDLLLQFHERFFGLVRAIQAHDYATLDLRQWVESATEMASLMSRAHGTVATTRGWTSSDSES